MTTALENYFLTAVNRRQILRAMGGAAALFGLTGCAAFGTSDACISSQPGLRTFAEPAHRYFGVAVQSSTLRGGVLPCVIAREANMVVPEGDLKWPVVQPAEGRFNFTGYETIAAFSRANKITFRGHTLVWHGAMPDWAKQRLRDRRDPAGMLENHINTVVRHTAGTVDDWDVVNEAVDHLSPRADGLRESLWLKALGPDFIAAAFRLAHAANPKARLVYNDYDMEFADSPMRRKSVLALLTKLKKENVPVHALGLQSHLACDRPMAGRGFTDFLKEVRALGLDIIVTELDVNSSQINGTDDEKAACAGRTVASYLDRVQQDGPLNTVVTWGISSRHSWLLQKYATAAHPLPLDAAYQPLPMWYMLRDHWLTPSTNRQG